METWLHSAISTAWQVIAPSVREIRSILGQPPPSSFTWPHAVILGSWNRRPKIPPTTTSVCSHLGSREVPNLGDHEHHTARHAVHLATVDILRYTGFTDLLEVSVQRLRAATLSN